MGCCGWPGGGSGTPADQAGILVSRTTEFDLDGTEQNPTFDTLVESDPTGNFLFTPGADVITIGATGSYRLSINCTTRNESVMLFKLSIENNGVEVANIAVFWNEGTDQPGVDWYPGGLSLEKISLTAGTVKVIVQEVSRSGSGTNVIEPNFTWSMAQNTGVKGADGNNTPGSFSTDEFLAYATSDIGGFHPTTVNAFQNDTQTASNMSVLFDPAGVVDTANSKVVLSEGTWVLIFTLKAGDVGSDKTMNALIKTDPDGTPTDYDSGTQVENGANGVNSSVCSTLIKSDGTLEVGFYIFSDASTVDLLGSSAPFRTKVIGYRINTDGP